MVMSGNGERIVFVLARPGDEASFTGGTIARLRGDDARVVVAYGTMTGETAPAAHRALGELGVSDWRMLPQASGADNSMRQSALREAIHDVGATAVVIGPVDDALRELATGVAHAVGVPVFLSRRVSEAAGERLTAIDVSDFVDRKLRALAWYPERWSVDNFGLVLADGTRLAVGGSETYVRLDAPRPEHTDAQPPTLAGRIAMGGAGVLGGVFVGVLGTIAHQASLRLGPVTLPLGLIIALIASAALLVGLRLVLHDRLVVGLCALGMLLTIFALSLRGTGGSVLVPEGLPGTLWTLVPACVAALVLAWPQIPARRRSA